MGEVYLAEDTRLHRKVALKSLSELPTAEARERLLREARADATLNHPHIAAVYDICEGPDRSYIVMEYVPGETLASRLRHGPLPVATAVTLGIQIADALAYAHAHGVIHRDLKPANVMLTPDGCAKVLDFGLARIVNVEDADSTLSNHSVAVVKGTPAYLAPERLLGQPADARTDVYGLGLMLFEMTTAQRAFGSSDVVGMAVASLTQPTPVSRELNPEIPERVSDVICKAMAREPERRYQSGAELKADLENALRSDTPSSAATVVAPPPPVWWKQPAFRMAALAAVAAAIAASVLWPRTPPAGTPSQVPVIVVLPLSNDSGDLNSDQLAAGMANVLTADLARIPGINVVSREATLRYLAQRKRDPAAVAHEFAATHVVDAGLQRAGDRLVVKVTLIKTGSSLIAWSNSFDGRVDDLLTVERQLVDGIVKGLEIKLPAQARQTLERRPTDEPEAFRLYAEARALAERLDVPGNLERAIGKFNQAIDRDADFALAHAGLGEAYWAKYDETKDASFVSGAMTAIAKAQQLDPTNPAVRISASRMYAGTGKHDEAIAELTKAIELQPASDEAHRLRARSYTELGRHNDAVKAYLRAIELQPNYWRSYSSLGVLYYNRGQYAEAALQFQRITELAPDNSWGFANLGAAYHKNGDTTRALENYKRALDISPTDTAYSNIGTIHFDEGRYAEAAEAYRKASALNPSHPTWHHNLGDALGKLGRRQEQRDAYSKAAALLRTMVQVNAKNSAHLALLAVCEAKLGQPAKALEHVAAAMRIDPDNVSVLYRSATVYARAGKTEAALAALESAIRKGESTARARSDESFESLRDNPAFQQLVREIR